MYKKASKFKLRFQTPKGQLSVEQLWSLPMSELVSTIKTAKKVIDINTGDDALSFLDESKKTDEKTLLTFNILKDIYLTRMEEMETRRQTRENKVQNEKILSIIHEKKEGALKEKPIEELEALLKK
ncbi:MAG: hypothetical protein PF569_03175 [Candidatus Woesearchaeota archaeon]|jgi:hypothetical protein|nr:hypothetical protein [Candidatus Woesearchaeota archaeon]